MAVFSGPQLVTNGLILNLDVASRKSFIESSGNQRSLINTANWSLGSGGVTGFAANQTTSTENQRVTDTDPWGNTTIVWETRPSGDGNNDGGWEGSFFNIDKTKTYRSAVWVRRTSSTSGGTFYHGLHTNGTGDTYHLVDSASQTNPYWDYRATSGLTQNQWYLNVGFIRPFNWAGTTAHPDSGFWIPSGSKTASNAGNVYADVKFPSDATQAYQRVYHFYCGDSTTRLQFAYPRWDLVDGTEPSIAELLSQSPGILYDQSGYRNNHFLGGYYVPTEESPKSFTLDGSTKGFTRLSALNGVSTSCTVVIWYKTTDTQELWVMGNNSGGVYLSASASNNYYHSSCGTPTNFVDLNTVIRPDSPVNYRNGAYHMWEAKGVDFSGWTRFDWFLYPGGWQLAGNVGQVLVYNRSLTAAESAQNFSAFRRRYGV